MNEVVTISGIKDAFKLFEEKLGNASESLNQQDKVAVQRLITLPEPGFTLPHPRGIFGILYIGDFFKDDENIKSTTLKMKDDLMIGVISAIRFYDNPNASIENYPMIPAEYTEIARNAVSGIEVLNNRPEYERMIKPVRTELVFEEKAVWVYLTTFSIPIDFIKI